MPDKLLGAMTKREQDFFQKGETMEKAESKIQKEDVDLAWQPQINVESEREKALSILTQIVPANEVYLTSSKSQNASNLKRLQG